MLFPICLLISFNAFSSGTDVIYNNDDRVEVDSYKDEVIRAYSKSVAVKVQDRKLEVNPENSNLINFLHIPLKDAIDNICPNERFSDQNQFGDCSGFLVAKDKLLTAGHCVFSDYDCENNSWVFDYKLGTKELLKDQVYKCKKIITQEYTYNNNKILDYAIIELDRPTINRPPLPMRKNGFPVVGTKLAIIGHPLGLPMKVADNAKIGIFNDEESENVLQTLKLRKYYFTASTDSYGGNSGSPVINLRTKKVEGILIQGADDFSFNSELGCMQSVKLKFKLRNAYEKVMRITKIKKE